jgi:hypothetical protein
VAFAVLAVTGAALLAYRQATTPVLALAGPPVRL